MNIFENTVDTVEGRNSAPVDVVDIPVSIGFYTSIRWLVAWDF